MAKLCLSCGRGFHEECLSNCESCHPEPEILVIEGSTSDEPKQNKQGGTFKDLKDPHSTGRKRAAKLYPLDKEAPCEWQGKKNCGGGRVPIVGCLNGKQVARHHGPVKDTTRNHLGNVHRICTRCHNHWHELNDLVYNQQEYGLLPHDPEEASQQELADDEVLWITGKINEKYTLASSKNKGVKFHE